MLIRSWNLFHGNSCPPSRTSYLEEMVRLASADGPDVLLLQEVPAWALKWLAGWSGMTAVGDLARSPRLPPFLDRMVTALHTGLFRSLFTGQANAILVASGLRVLERTVLVLNPGGILGVGRRERRICQIVRLVRPGGTSVVVGNLHATNSPRFAAAEAARAAVVTLEFACAGEPVALGGDFNLEGAAAALDGWSAPGPGIDHLLVRGAEPSPLHSWPDGRRRREGILLSDHPPVELQIP
jgi:endonuclease/exonuclease/phosphatase family metal-dependent hydrolase